MKITLQTMLRNQLNRMHDQDELIDDDENGVRIVKYKNVRGELYSLWFCGQCQIAGATIDEAIEWICA